jgi:4'-phosphopantetheinyl transferase
MLYGNSKVSVFYAAVPSSADMIVELAELLDDAEREKAARFAFDKDRSLFITAHALLRHSLWRVTGLSSVQFRVNQFGKPELVSPQSEARVRFNLSHSNALAACALSFDYDVGIDVEMADNSITHDEIAAKYFTPDEQAQLTAYDKHGCIDSFFQIWTLKEAAIKAIGRGLSMPLQDFSVTLEPPSVRFSHEHIFGERHWHIEQRKLNSLHWASLVVCKIFGVTISTEWFPVSIGEILGDLRCATLK